MQSSAPGTGRRAKNLSRYEVEPLRRVVGEPEADESLVVFVMVHVRVLDPAVVRDVEGPPILRLDRAGDRSEPVADERRNVLPVFRSGRRSRVEDLLRLPLHVPGELPVTRLRRVVEDPIAAAQLVHQASHPRLHRGKFVHGQRAVLGRRPHPRTGDGLVHARRNGVSVKEVLGSPPSPSRPRTRPSRPRHSLRRLRGGRGIPRSEEHTSELQSPSVISYAVFCLKKKKKQTQILHYSSYHHNSTSFT